MLLKENPVFKIKQPSWYDRQYNGNKIMHLFFPCGPVPNDYRTGTSPQPGGLGEVWRSSEPLQPRRSALYCSERGPVAK